MQKADIEITEQTLNNYLFEHAPEYHVIRYRNQLRLFIEPLNGNRAAAQYIYIENKIRLFYVNEVSEKLRTALRMFCLLYEIEFSDGLEKRGLADDENYALRP